MPSLSRGYCRLLGLLSLLLLVLAVGCIPPGRTPQAGSGDYLLCFWNTENFFDNKLNDWHNEPDKAFDRWFAEDARAFEQKVKFLTEVLAPLNDGKGPDILALAEVEAESNAAEALRVSLNQAIKLGTPPYEHLLMKNPHGGRNIVTVILTRLPVVANRTQLLGKRQRMLEGHIKVDDQDLVVLATHWTSRVSDKVDAGRDKYAKAIYGRFRAMYEANPNVSLLACGDFNDNPDDPSVTEYLHATGDLEKVKAAGDPPVLFDVFADLWAKNKGGKEVGTHFYRGKAFIFDQIVVSPGMVNGKGGWQCQVDTAEIVKHQFRDKKGHPIHFGTQKEKHERGPSDHLPVTVRLKLAR